MAQAGPAFKREPAILRVPTQMRRNPFLLDAVALETLALQLAGAAYSSSLFASALFRGLFVVTTQLHFALDTFTLQLLLERTKGLINIVVANHDLHKPKHLTKRMR